MLRGCLLILCLWRAFGGEALAHNGFPLVVALEQRTDDLYSLSVAVPASVPEFAKPEIFLPVGCDAVESSNASVERLFRCGKTIEGGDIRLAFPAGAPANPILLRISWQSGETRSVLAEPGATQIVLPRPENPPRVFRQYAALGVHHIMTGYDHLLFLLCLLMIAGPTKKMVLAVSGFTLGHALTITAATLGIARVPSAPVEATIALSIMFFAAEIVRPNRDKLIWRHPIAVPSVFGLLHGFGFAAALRETGLPQTELPLALLSFNIGIEAGQLMFILAAVLCWRLIEFLPRLPRITGRSLALPLGYGIGCIAAYWFVERAADLVG